jgi:predicted nucleotidyltransferase
MKDIDRMRITLAKHRSDLRERFKVRDIGVLGSFVRKEQRKASDVDILVEFVEPLGLFEFYRLGKSPV